MSRRSGIECVLEFIEAINQHDVDRLIALMTEDHTFVDARGAVIQERERLRDPWQEYFRLFPDYQIVVSDIFENDHVIAVFGTAGGTYAVNGKLLAENRWEVPASWKALVRGGQVARWQVYTDNEPVRKILSRSSKK